MSKLEQYEQLKKQIVAKDWQEYETKVKAIIAKLKIQQRIGEYMMKVKTKKAEDKMREVKVRKIGDNWVITFNENCIPKESDFCIDEFVKTDHIPDSKKKPKKLKYVCTACVGTKCIKKTIGVLPTNCKYPQANWKLKEVK